MKSICFSESKTLPSQSMSHMCGASSRETFFVFSCHVIFLSILEYSPLANVAHDISPVPVLNCELLKGPEAQSERVLPSRRSF